MLTWLIAQAASDASASDAVEVSAVIAWVVATVGGVLTALLGGATLGRAVLAHWRSTEEDRRTMARLGRYFPDPDDPTVDRTHSIPARLDHFETSHRETRDRLEALAATTSKLDVDLREHMTEEAGRIEAIEGRHRRAEASRAVDKSEAIEARDRFEARVLGALAGVGTQLDDARDVEASRHEEGP